MGYLKGKSSLMIFEKYANMKYKYGNRHFWCRGYYVDTVGRNKKVIEQYIRNQLQQDYEEEQLSIKEYVDPFTGQPVKDPAYEQTSVSARSRNGDALRKEVLKHRKNNLRRKLKHNGKK